MQQGLLGTMLAHTYDVRFSYTARGESLQKADLRTKSNHRKGNIEVLWTCLKSSSPNKICEWPEAELICGNRRSGEKAKIELAVAIG